MATITLYADRINQMPAGLRSVRTAVDAFRENVDTLRISVVAIDSSICTLTTSSALSELPRTLRR